jgi:N6-adenosine-specific RNA methylase IME4
VTDSIIKLDQATRMLAEIRSIDDAKQLIDLAEAARVYAQQVRLGIEAQNHAAEIKLRAQRRAGEILDSMDKAKGGQPYQEHNSTGYILKPVETYDDLGIDKVDAHRWQTIAKMPEQEFEARIAERKDAEEKLTTAGIYREARAIAQADHVKDIKPPSGKYQIIYADPPWQYQFGFDIHGAAQRHYNTMSIDDLCRLPIKDLADDNAVLFLWVTSPKLADCFAVIDAWGFVYKTSFVWDKVKHVMGHYNSVRHEFLLICTRGSYPKQSNTLIDSVVTIERTDEHSEKPERFRKIIDEMYPAGTRIELFARKRVDGWDTWGSDDISNTDR